MPFYNTAGKIPKKRHTIFKNPKGGIYYEELVSREGFSYMYSNLYHLRMPTRVQNVPEPMKLNLWEESIKKQHRPHHFIENLKLRSDQNDSLTNSWYSDKLEISDCVEYEKNLLSNKDVRISLIYKAKKEKSERFFRRNAHFDELYFVQKGRGTLKTNYGNLDFYEGDYIVIPRGVIYQLNSNIRALLIESKSPIETPSKYRNRVGQLLEHSPFCERDIRIPTFVDPIDKEGHFSVQVKLEKGVQMYDYANHPFDVVGWDGYYFPWILNINDFEPITGSIHQPPPVHQTFQGKGFVICSFVSRIFDYHPDAIPAPYPHSNVDSDEVIFYSKGNFMSRKGISAGSVTYHPMGLPHGPHPGKYEDSIGKKRTEELAVMIDTFEPLNVAKQAEGLSDKNYPLSWLEKK